ncbi:CHAT domain-containing protein [Actinomadura sp. NAK00032]|uniref:CHAT domain-containing protein n=1 Tax=Actinomadura sp. NAK00032 TaxID=2742128 RepID=UPI00159070C8|nr:CHAT domain-containing protein [Actinomadura sp. NAK00032]QKW33322.1 CHAT domain-containing protein [Actinomadura sp. NAK00032]
MPLDDLSAKLADLLAEYEATGDRALPLGAEAAEYAEGLWQNVRAVDTATASPVLIDAYAQASVLLARLHYERHRLRGGAPGDVDLARAVVALAPVAADRRRVPPPMRPLLGRASDDEVQAAAAHAMLRSPSGDPVLIDAAIALMTPAAARRPADVSRQVALCTALRLRHERDGSPDDLDKAVTAGEKAVAGHPETAVAWEALAAAYRCRYRLRGDPEDLRRSIRLLERVAQDDGGPHVLADLGTAHRLLFEHSDDSGHLNTAVRLCESALTAAGEDAARPAWRSELSAVLLRRHERTGSRADLDRAADLAEQVAASAPEDDPDRGVYLADAATAVLRRQRRTGDPDELDRAVVLAGDALETLPEDDRRRPIVLRSLADALHRRSIATGSLDDLNRAATVAGWALAAVPAGHPARGPAAAHVAAVHLTRYTRTGVLTDIARAVEAGEESLASPGSLPARWSMLGEAYRLRSGTIASDDDLQRAIDLGQRAVGATAADDFALAGRLARLAAAYWTRYQGSGDTRALDRAIILGGRAVARTPADDAELPRRWADLAAARLARYRAGGSPGDLAAAVDLAERAWNGLPPGHPDRPQAAAGLCRAYQARVERGGDAPPVERIHDLAGLDDEQPTASPADRVAARHAAGLLAQASGAGRQAVELLDAAAALLPSVAPREAGWADQQHRIGAHAGLVAAGVAAHCGRGDPAGAVEFAELGRGVLLAAQAGTRAGAADLHDRDARLADRFQWVCERLATPGFGVDERRRWWHDHDTLLGRIRALPGLERFQAAPRLDDLRAAAAGGTVVLVNAGPEGGDAVLVTADRPSVRVPLPELRDAAVAEQVTVLLAALSGGGSLSRMMVRRRTVRGVLAWLWRTAVGPVADALGPPRPGPHRVWWLPTGALGLLPLHAAEVPGEAGALDVMVSSFVPSLRALRDARNRPPATRREPLTVVLEQTPGHADLPGAAAEASLLGGAMLTGPGATAANVLTALDSATWAHFACHAVANPVSPAVGGLLLHDRTLTLPEIGGLRPAEAELAYLSACSTADHGVRYADEVLHLASAFQLAGFRHVVASLWPVDDAAAAEAATAFYAALPEVPSADAAASALREVTLGMRARHHSDPALWAPLVHSGP